MEINKTKILLVYTFETWSFAWKKEQKLGEFKNKMLRTC